MEKMMAVIKNKIVQIALLAFFGVLFIAGSYTPKSPTVYRGGNATTAQIDPLMLALGVALLILAFLIYRKWVYELNSK